MAAAATGAGKRSVNVLIGRIKDARAEVRTQAWLGAGKVGAPAIKPLAEVVTDEKLEVARAAKRALWQIVRHAGRPGAQRQKRRVETELIRFLAGDQPASVRREVLWMLSEIGGNRSVKPIAELLSDRQLREEARMALQRIPGRRSLAALQAGLEAAPDDFKLNIAQSLRQRGVEVPGLTCVKLVPTKKTSVEPI
jgi:HEAT repeat protein